MIERHLVRVGVLILLHDEAYSGKGWFRRRARGWRFREELEQVIGIKLREVLPYLAGRGWLDRVDVRESGRGKPTWMYRISQRGARVIENLLDWGYYEIPEAWTFDTVSDLRALYAPVEAWQGLDVLRRQAGLTRAVRRFGVPGWMSAAEVRRVAPRVLPKHLEWLLSRHLVEHRRPAGEGVPAGAPWLYRITALGLRAELVEAAPIQNHPPLFVHTEIRETEAPTRRDVDAAWRALIGMDHPASAPSPAQARSERAVPDQRPGETETTHAGDGA